MLRTGTMDNNTSKQNPIIFYPGKKQLMPIVVNIAISPLLLYLFRLWPWPPTSLHMAAFFLTGILALRFYRNQLKKPKLVFDQPGIISSVTYAADDIVGVKPYMRALKVWVMIEGREKEKVINLWWASKEDLQRISSLATERYSFRE